MMRWSRASTGRVGRLSAAHSGATSSGRLPATARCVFEMSRSGRVGEGMFTPRARLRPPKAPFLSGKRKYRSSRTKHTDGPPVFAGASNLRGFQFLARGAWCPGPARSGDRRSRGSPGQFLSYFVRVASGRPRLERRVKLTCLTTV